MLGRIRREAESLTINGSGIQGIQSVGVEYMFIRTPEKVKWLTERMESTRNITEFTEEEQKEIYMHLKQAVGFEKFIHKKFVGQKRFSLEGAEILIPALMAVIEKGAKLEWHLFLLLTSRDAYSRSAYFARRAAAQPKAKTGWPDQRNGRLFLLTLCGFRDKLPGLGPLLVAGDKRRISWGIRMFADALSQGEQERSLGS